MMLDEEQCCRAIGEAFPELDIQSVRYFAAGWDYEMWEVNGELLFRFPLRPECAEALRVEARLLPALREHLSVAVPVPEYVSEGCESFPLPFFAYRKLPGEPLANDRLGSESMLAVADQAGRFLAELHAFPVEQAAALGVPGYTAESWRHWYVELHERIRAIAYDVLPADLVGAVASFWREFLGNEAFFRFEPVLIHRDLDDAHKLVEGGRLTGVIDFADACVGDPALDFAGCDGAFRTQMLDAYGCSAGEAASLSARADVYRKNISPFHAVIHGIESAQAYWVQRGIDAIRNQLLQPRLTSQIPPPAACA